MRIGINCGHTISGMGSGAVGYLNESKETRAVGYALMEMLRNLGHTVVDCTDEYASSMIDNLAEICRLANAQPLDMFLSVHFNAGGGTGTEVFTVGAKDTAHARDMVNAICGLGFKNRGVKDGSKLYVIRHTNAPAALVEVCFVDTANDAEKYRKIGAKKVAEALCRAIAGKVPGEIEKNNNSNKEDLTLSQYEELKNAIAGLKESIDKMSKPEPMIYNYIDDNMPAWAREAVKWAVNNGIIHGTGEGLELDDTKLWFLTVLYRTAKMQ